MIESPQIGGIRRILQRKRHAVERQLAFSYEGMERGGGKKNEMSVHFSQAFCRSSPIIAMQEGTRFGSRAYRPQTYTHYDEVRGRSRAEGRK